ncbi:family 43 glycosylhydrolase [Peribacillus psychrosaccharolyticus]|uniref:family 43 glycosylhydrolase n=1 Tax=Peribacillus psychrosaccharolyticus TaxID=1407 RepID=UPI003D2C1563
MQIIKPEEVEITASIGSMPLFPKTIDIELTNGAKSTFKVEWPDISVKELLTSGELVVEGTIISQEFPSPLVKKRADPFIQRHIDGFYYFTGSHPEYDRIVLRRAKTIKGLSEAEEVVIWEKHKAGIMSEHIWAPELHYINNKWYIYYAAGDKDDVWAIRPYVLECSYENPLTGVWIEKGPINLAFQSFSLDATLFEHNGSRYLIWAQKVENDTISNLYIAKMRNPWSIENEQIRIATPEYEWEQYGFHVNEGAAVIKRNGHIFVSYSASATDDRYVMGLLSAKDDSDLLDPKSWYKTPQPVFVSSEETKKFGPGHNSFTMTEDGTADLLVYHARPYKKIVGNPLYDHNRHAYVQRLFWHSDGTPFFGVPGYELEDKVVTAKIIVR